MNLVKLPGWIHHLLVTSALLIPVVAMADDLPAGLVLHFDFDQIENHKVSNLKGPVSEGVVKGARFVPVEGCGNALSVRQNEVPAGYVEVADHPALNKPAFTVAAWVCPRRAGVSGAIACKHDWLDGGARGFTLRSNHLNQMNFTIGAGGWKSVDSKTLLSGNTWVHVAAAFDGKTLRMYFNGKLEDTAEIPDDYTPSPYPMRVGHGAFKLDRHRKFDGKIDDLMIWTRSLNPAEFRSVYEAGRDRRPPPPTDAQVAELVMQLGDDSFQVRQAARWALVDLGPAVVPVLTKHFKSEDPEIRKRVRTLSKQLEPPK